MELIRRPQRRGAHLVHAPVCKRPPSEWKATGRQHTNVCRSSMPASNAQLSSHDVLPRRRIFRLSPCLHACSPVLPGCLVAAARSASSRQQPPFFCHAHAARFVAMLSFTTMPAQYGVARRMSSALLDTPSPTASRICRRAYSAAALPRHSSSNGEEEEMSRGLASRRQVADSST